ncbi:Fic family protein [Halobacteriovorax sp. HLS]|uniref:Fic family protein n=1 Tax=Halobacteriovorax sp. HLS TaxID=2234000 RepID=UPI0013E3A460|nr:Fic family protein [Halobacteriovorax sp. HLS]
MINSKLKFLYRALNNEELDTLSTKLIELDSLRSNISLTPELLARLNLHRVVASSTLKRKGELEKWDDANKFVFSKIGHQLDFHLITQVNECLTEKSGIRTTEVFGAGLMYLKKEFLQDEINNFEKILSMRNNIHPIEFALKVYIWIVSTHPFTNGNGRTARLIADKILLESNYLPLCFADSRSGHCAYFEELDNDDLCLKINSFFKGLIRSYCL